MCHSKEQKRAKLYHFKSDSISIRAAVKTVIEKPQTFVEMKEAEGLELLQQEELCNMILDYRK